MNCEYLVKNNHCKFLSKYIYLDKNYCTRHYNKLNKNNLQSNKLNNKSDNIEINEIKSILQSNNILYDNIEFINKGTFNKVYLISYQNTKFIIKYQNLKNDKNLLYYEYLILSNHLTDTNYIVNIYFINKQTYYYKKDEYALLCQEYLYNTINEKKIEYNFSINDILNIGIQLIKIMEYIHSKKYLYIDLKPDNIMFKNKTDLSIKLIDFNASDKYIDMYSNFYPNNKISSRKGNDLFSSRNINLGNRGERFDDIESILYIILYLLDDENIINISNQKNIINIIKIKENIFTLYISKYEFINKFIQEINNNNKISHKKPNYRKYIKILTI